MQMLWRNAMFIINEILFYIQFAKQTNGINAYQHEKEQILKQFFLNENPLNY